MGGNVFTHLGYTAQRMDRKTFDKVLNKVHNFLDELNIKYHDIAFIHNKKDFGDIDILIEYDDSNNVFEKIKENNYKLCATNETTIKNGKVLSVLVDGLYQIDFIKERKELVEYHQAYLSHNDLGNLIGRCVKESGYKHGHDGLYYTLYNESKSHKKEFLISTDYRTVLNLLGLSVEQFDSGFETVEDMFDYISSNKYFKSSYYKFENLNNRNKVRDAKRKNYNLFLQYIKDIPDSNISLPSYEIAFPEIIEDVENYKDECRRVEEIKNKFSGKIVMELTGLKHKELGNFIQMFKNKYDVYHMSSDDIKEKIIMEYNLL